MAKMTSHHCPLCEKDYELTWDDDENIPYSYYGYTVVCHLCNKGIPKEEREVREYESISHQQEPLSDVVVEGENREGKSIDHL